MKWASLRPGPHLLLQRGMLLKATRDFVTTNYGSAMVPVVFLSGITYKLSFLTPHNLCPAGEEPTEENTMAGWILEGSEAVRGLKQSSRQIIEAVLDGRLVPQP